MFKISAVALCGFLAPGFTVKTIYMIMCLLYLLVASPVPYDRHGDDDLPPIREDQEFTSSVEHQSPECDQNMSSEVGIILIK